RYFEERIRPMSGNTTTACKTLTEVDREVLVHIGVRRINGIVYKYTIDVFPNRLDDILIFHANGGWQESPHKPRRVTWLVHGLQQGQTIKISPKVPNAGFFDDDSPEIPYPK